MTNLSELLPSGGGAKEFSAVASGTLTNGQTVALKADGKVEAIVNTALTEGVTTPTVIDPTNQVAYTTSVYDPLNKTVIIAYAGGSTAGYYIIGSFSGGNLTYTSPQTFDSSTSKIPRLAYDTDNNKVVIIYTNNNNQWRTRIGTPTATSITWGSAVPWNTHALTSTTGDVAYCPSAQKLVFLSRNSSNYPEIFYGTVSGTSVSYSTYSTYGSGYQGNLRLAFKPTGGVGLMTGMVSSNNYGAYITIITTSTNFPQFVTQAYFRSQAVKTYGCPVVYDSGNDRYLISFTLNSGSNPIYVVSTDAAGDFGTANTPQNLSSNNFESDLVYISSNSGGTTGNFLLTFAYTSGTQKMTAQPVDLSASYYPTFPTSYQIQNGADISSFNSLTSVYDPNANKAVVVYNDINLTPNTGKSSVYTPSGFETNVSNFIGITSEAIANGATGKVNPQGGVATTQLPLSAVYNNQNFSLSGQSITTPEEIRFKSDGTKFYILGNNVTVYQYAMSTAWDVSTASYENKSFSVSSQDANSQGLALNSDGTSFYTCGQNRVVYQYDLTTAYDISTASYASKSFSLTTQMASGSAWGLDFDSTGTKMYAIHSNSGTVYQYTLSSAFDVSTASYASKSFDTSSQTSDSTGIAITSDGATLYVVSSASDQVFKYTLSTPFDIATASYSGFSFTTTTQDNFPYGVAVKTDETQLYITGSQNDSVYQYSLSTSLTLNTVYYVQDDGSLSTTSSSVTAGKAISTTQLILNGAS